MLGVLAANPLLITMLVWAGACATADIRTRRIPDWLTLPAAGAGLVHLVALQSTLAGGLPPVWAIAGVALVLLITLPGFALRQLGGGDIKMLVAIALLAGALAALSAFVVASLLAALCVLAASVARLWQRLRHAGRLSAEPGTSLRAMRIPWGPGLALGLGLYFLLMTLPLPATQTGGA